MLIRLFRWKKARNIAAGENSSVTDGPAASGAEDYVSSRSDPNPANIPSTDYPLPDDAENPDEETPEDFLSRSKESDDRHVH